MDSQCPAVPVMSAMPPPQLYVEAPEKDCGTNPEIYAAVVQMRPD